MTRLRCLRLLACTSAALCSPVVAKSQLPVVQVNLAAEAFVTSLPFWQEFVIQGSIPKDIDRVIVAYFETGKPPDNPPLFTWEKSAGFEPEGQFSLELDAIQPNRPYTFCLAVYGPLRSTNIRSNRLYSEKRGQPATPCGELFESKATDQVPQYIRVVTGQARSLWSQHFDTDLGVMYSDVAGYVGVITGVHIHLVPVRKDLPLSSKNVNGLQSLARRISVYVGISPVEIRSDTEQPIEKTTLGIPVVGIALRGPLSGTRSSGILAQVMDMMRISGGVMFFTQKDANPLVTTKHAKRDIFLSVTGDLDIKSVLTPFIKIIGLQ